MSAASLRTTRHQPPVAETDAAKEIGCARRTLANWRSQGRGPRFHSPVRERYVVYKVSELDAWLEGDGPRSSTSDPGLAADERG